MRRARIVWGTVVVLPWLLGVVVWGWPEPGGAQDQQDVFASVRALPVWHDGRIQHLQQFAKSQLTFIAGPEQLKHMDPVVVLLRMMADPEGWEDQPVVWVTSKSVRQAVGISQEVTHISVLELQTNPQVGQAVLAAMQRFAERRSLPAFEREMLGVHGRQLALEAVLRQDLQLVPPATPAEGWQSILMPAGYPHMTQVALKRTWAELLDAVREGEDAMLQARGWQLAQLLHNLASASSAYARLMPSGRERWHVASLFRWGLTPGGQQF